MDFPIRACLSGVAVATVPTTSASPPADRWVRQKLASTRMWDGNFAGKIQSIIRASFQRSSVDLQRSFFSPRSEMVRASKKSKSPELESDGRICASCSQPFLFRQSQVGRKPYKNLAACHKPLIDRAPQAGTYLWSQTPGSSAVAFCFCSTRGRTCRSIHGLSAHGSNRNEIHGLVRKSASVYESVRLTCTRIRHLEHMPPNIC
jgi:hypothetical protein